MAVSTDVVRHIESLARLRFDDAEREALSGELSRMLAYFEEIAEISTEGVTPTAHVAPLTSSLREDAVSAEPRDSEALLRLAADASPPFFRVPRFRQG